MNRFKSLLVILILMACVARVEATTELLDDFNRSGGLNGSSPSVNPHGMTWTATSAFTTDGSKIVAEGSFLQAAYVPLPVPITSGNIYTLSDTSFFNAASSDDLAFMMLGFFDSSPSWNGSTTVDGGTAIAIGPRNNRNSVATLLDGHTHPSDVSSLPDGTNGVTLGVKLYETSPGSWVADIVELAPTAQVLTASPTAVDIGPIATIGFISAATHPPFTDNFKFEVTAVPEPASLIMLSSGGMLVLGLRRQLSLRRVR